MINRKSCSALIALSAWWAPSLVLAQAEPAADAEAAPSPDAKPEAASAEDEAAPAEEAAAKEEPAEVAPEEEAAAKELAEEAAPVEKELAPCNPFEADAADESDWIHTASGEWFKGSVKEVREGALLVSSAELGDVSIGWGNVTDMRTSARYTVVTKDNVHHDGTINVSDGKLTVETEDGLQTIEVADVMSIVSEHTREIDNWSFKLSVGAGFSKGNSPVVDYTAYSLLKREDERHRTIAEYNASYGRALGEANTHRHRGNLSWNVFISPVMYLTPLFGELLYDRFQNIQLQVLASTGIGFHTIKTANVSLDLELTGGYGATNYLSVEAGADERDRSGVVIPRLVFDWGVTSDIGLGVDWKTVLQVSDIERTYHQGAARFSFGMTDILTFNATATYARQETPVADENGDVPFKSDYGLILGMGLVLD